MKDFREFIIEAGNIQGNRNKAQKVNIPVRTGPGGVMGRIVNQTPTTSKATPVSAQSSSSTQTSNPKDLLKSAQQKVSNVSQGYENLRARNALVRNTSRTIKAPLAAGAVYSGVDRIQRGDVVGGALDIGQGLTQSRRLNTAAAKATERVAQRVAGEAGKKLATKLGSKVVPGLNIASAGYDAYQRASKGDWTGAALSAGEALPGVGLGFVAANIARDASGESQRVEKQAAQRKPQTPISVARQQERQKKVPGTIAGSGVVGAGGKTTYSKTPKGAAFVSTGTGQQRRTAQLPSQMLLPSGKVGDLAFKGQKPTYLTRPSLEQQRQDPISRFMRAVNPAFKKAEQDVQATQQRQAAASTRKYYGKLGITPEKQQQLNPAIKPVTPKPPVKVSGKLK